MEPKAAEVKSIIVGLLTSNPLKCTIHQLGLDFSNIIGFKIPVRQLGFKNIEDYLRSIPDVCIILGNGPSALVQGLSTSPSAHISLMVAKQKKNVPPYKKNLIKSVIAPQDGTKFNKSVNKSSSRNELAQVVSRKENTRVKESEKDEDCSQSAEEESFVPENTTRIPAVVQSNLRQLIGRFPNGISCTHLPKQYQNMFCSRLKFETYRYISLIELCADLPRIFNYFKTADDYILYGSNKRIPCLNQNEIFKSAVVNSHTGANTFGGSSRHNWGNGSNLIPSDAVPLGDVIPRLFPDEFRVGEYVDVAVAEIYSISEFFLYSLYGELKPLMKELQNFFYCQCNQYLIPTLFLQKGLYCTVKSKGVFYRCVIVNLLQKQSGSVRVLFIDYGSVRDVSNNEIWYLPKQFAQVPCQAIKANLVNIKHKDEAQACNKFKGLIENKTLVAEILHVNKQDKTLDIYLDAITDQDNVIFINDSLVEKNYACYLIEKDILGV